MNRHSVWALCKKDIVDMSRNGVVVFLLLIPISLSWVYGTLLTSGGLKPPSVVLFDEGTSAFADFVRDSEVFEIVAPPASWAKAQELVRRGEARGAILLPAGFDAALNSQHPPEIVLYLDASKRVAAAVIQEGLAGLLRAYVGQDLPASIETQQVRGITARHANVPTWITIAILLAGVNMVPTLLLEEKDKKTLDAILVTMTSRSEIVLGKCLVGFAMALIMALVILVLNQGFIGNLSSLLAVLALGAVAFVFTGLLIGGLARNVQIGSLISSLVLLPLVVVATMAEVSPAISAVSRFLPSFYLLDGIELAMFLDSPLPTLWLHLLVLALLGGLSFVGSVLVLRGREM
ncbi:MAG: ABC transporter permease [Proteobacteria bacterium]|nr:ABC transporter permease [Pseudomonadota bacterium]